MPAAGRAGRAPPRGRLRPLARLLLILAAAGTLCSSQQAAGAAPPGGLSPPLTHSHPAYHQPGGSDGPGGGADGGEPRSETLPNVAGSPKRPPGFRFAAAAAAHAASGGHWDPSADITYLCGRSALAF